MPAGLGVGVGGGGHHQGEMGLAWLAREAVTSAEKRRTLLAGRTRWRCAVWEAQNPGSQGTRAPAPAMALELGHLGQVT